MRGHIRRRGKQSWEIAYDVGLDGDGNRRQRFETVKGLKRDAEQRLTEIMAALGQGDYVERTGKTVKEFLEAWILSRRRDLSPTTWSVYKYIVNAHLVRRLGSKQLQKLTWEAVESYYDGYRVGGIESTTLSERTLLHHHRLLTKAMKDAVKKGDLSRNPMDSVTAPSPSKPSIEAFPKSQNKQLLQRFEGQLQTMVMLALGTGLRRGELCGLMWDRVYLDAAELEVSRNLVMAAGRSVLKSPKTKGSARRIVLPSTIVNALRAHWAAQAREKLAAGEAYIDEGFVFARPDGTPAPPDTFTRSFKATLKDSEFAGLDVHSLRHCHASQLIADGINIKTISSRLGHSTIVITLDTYGHLLPGMDKAAANAIDESLAGL